MTNDARESEPTAGPGLAAKLAIVLAVAAVAGAALYFKNSGPPERAQAAAGSGEIPAVERPTLPRAPAPLPKLLDLGADKCIPCKAMAPILEKLREEYKGGMEVVFIDVWKNQAAGREYGVSVIPTQIFFDASGKELFRHEGFMGREDILGKWADLGVDISQPQTQTGGE